MARALIGTIGLAVVSGCTWMSGVVGGEKIDEAVEGDSSACAFEIVDSRAWVNRMPGPEPRGERPLVVSAQLADNEQMAVLRLSDRQKNGVLTLDVLASGEAPISGRLAYRGPVVTPMYSRVEIVCGGEVLHVIEDIERVY